MKLDNSAAWKEAVASLSANREVMAAIAGVFFLLPSLAFGLFGPQPEPMQNPTPEQTMKLMSEFYAAAAPFMIAMVVLQSIGVLAILTLCTDLSRPTVAEAIKRGTAGFFPYFGSSLILGFAVSMAGVLVGLAAATGLAALVALLVVALVAAMVFAGIRFSLTAPAVAVDRLRNPIAVLARSWALTRGNTGRIAWLLFLIIVAFLVIVTAVSSVSGVFAALIFGAGAARTVEAVLSSIMGSGFTVIFSALLAAIHRQLAGNTPGAVAATFD